MCDGHAAPRDSESVDTWETGRQEGYAGGGQAFWNCAFQGLQAMKWTEGSQGEQAVFQPRSQHGAQGNWTNRGGAMIGMCEGEAAALGMPACMRIVWGWVVLRETNLLASRPA